ncbi:molybdopterin-dependent oxidoreductase [Mycoplasmatota bacterium]|nr:molybdopterin-dependent oxidoreductase [Mycoplasmatota bacterium]
MSFSVVGKDIKKVDGIAKAKGVARYIGDIEFPGMLYAKILRSPHPHAKVLSVDISEAEKLDGVHAIVTPEHQPKTRYNMAGFPPNAEEFPLIEDQLILTDHPMYVGDPICAVAADTEEIAENACKLIKVEYEILPHVIFAEDAMKEDAPKLREEGNVMFEAPIKFGDIDAAFAESALIVKESYSTQKVYQATIEPTSGCVAMWDDSGKLTVYSPTQMPHLARKIIGTALDMRLGDIRLIKPHVGGGFGARLGLVIEPLTALLAKHAGRPVKLIYTREEAMAFSEHRHPCKMDMELGFTKEGRITGMRFTNIVEGGAYATHTPSIAGIVGPWAFGMYKMQAVDYLGKAVLTNSMYNGAYRGYGNPQASWAIENTMDIAAEKLGIDDLEIRKINGFGDDDIWPWSQLPVESSGLNECIDKGAESIGWHEKRGKKLGTSTKPRGIGMAVSCHVSGAKPGLLEISGAYVKINEDGTANLIIGNADIGQGSTTALAQICAEELGVKFEDIIVETDAVDTNYTLFDIGSHASRQMNSGGNVVAKAAREAKGKMLEEAAVMLDVKAGDLDAKDGIIFVKDNPTKSLTYGEVSFEAHFKPEGTQIFGTSSENPEGNPPVYAAQFAEVEVDTETGVVSVIKFVAAHDTGVVINPLNTTGQIDGGAHHGIGFALTEESVVNPETGLLENRDLANYKILTAMDMPEVVSIAVETPAKTSSHGQKSVGESGLIATAPAISNAVYNAIGVRITDLPITPDKVLAALAKK